MREPLRATPTTPQALARQILDRAGGNPFYINEILESLVERGILSPAATATAAQLRWVRRDEAIAVPTTVEAVVASRLDRLPDDERDVIRRAALLGRTFRVEDLAALTGVDPAPALVRLAARGLIAPTSARGRRLQDAARPPTRFRNLITKEVAYGGLAPDTRALLHSVAADRLQRSPGYRTRRRRRAPRRSPASRRRSSRPPARALVSAGLLRARHRRQRRGLQAVLARARAAAAPTRTTSATRCTPSASRSCAAGASARRSCARCTPCARRPRPCPATRGGAARPRPSRGSACSTSTSASTPPRAASSTARSSWRARPHDVARRVGGAAPARRRCS